MMLCVLQNCSRGKHPPSNPAVIYTGNDGGIWKTVDAGANWLDANTAGFSATQFSGLAVHPTDSSIVYAAVMGHLWDANRERGLYQTRDGGKTWKSSFDSSCTTGE